jgi:hypothetical protein
MTLHCSLPRGFQILVLLTALFLATTGAWGSSGSRTVSSDESRQVARIMSVRKVLENHYFVSRYPQIHYYMLYLSMRIAGQPYCAAYETPVLDEIADAFAAQGKDVEVMLKNKRLTLITPKGFKLKAHLVEARQC